MPGERTLTGCISGLRLLSDLLCCDTLSTHLLPFLQELLRMYFSALPAYQGVPLSQLRFSRVLFGGFPSFAASPLKPAFDRVLQASLTPQSPSASVSAHQHKTPPAIRACRGTSGSKP